MTAGAHEVARVREENESLRSDNLRLRAAVSSARPDTPAEWDVPQTPNSGAILAAESLANLMQEGGNLLAEREALRLENEALEIELLHLAEEYEDEDIGSYVGSIEGTPVESVSGVGEADGDELAGYIDDAALNKLLPLLSEGDALRAERESLRTERRDLLGTLQANGAPVTDHADVAAVDSDLEQRFLAAVEDVRSENDTLESEIKTLRDENARLKRRGSTPRVQPQSAAKVPAPVAFKSTDVSVRRERQPLKIRSLDVVEEDWDSAQIRQKEAMATLLRTTTGVVSPSNGKRGMRDSRPLPGLPESPEEADTGKIKGPPDMSQEQAIKGALHTLFRTLAR